MCSEYNSSGCLLGDYLAFAMKHQAKNKKGNIDLSCCRRIFPFVTRVMRLELLGERAQQ